MSIPADLPVLPPAQSRADLTVALQESGLVMVETSRDRSPAAMPSEPEIRLGRKLRQPVAPSSEPMIQVETRK